MEEKGRSFDEGFLKTIPNHHLFCLDVHREFGGIRMPSAAVATYERSDGSWEYFRGQVTSVTRATDL